MMVVVVVMSVIGCSAKTEPIQQNQTHEGRVVAVAPVLGGTFTNAYVVGAIIYFQDGSKVKVASNLDLLIGGYYIITTIPPVNEYWEYLEVDSVIYKP